jgi:hypothetical protein
MSTFSGKHDVRQLDEQLDEQLDAGANRGTLFVAAELSSGNGDW